MADQSMHFPKPPPSWGLNANTIIVLIGFVFTWGAMYTQLDMGRTANASNIERLEQRISLLEASTRILENHEQRLVFVERQTVDASAAMRAVEASLSALSSDIRVVREILSRIEGNGGVAGSR